jgi:hypothetical protein
LHLFGMIALPLEGGETVRLAGPAFSGPQTIAICVVAWTDGITLESGRMRLRE